jgi:hypothetical protein
MNIHVFPLIQFSRNSLSKEKACVLLAYILYTVALCGAQIVRKHRSTIVFSFRFDNWLITKFKFCKMSRVIYAIVCWTSYKLSLEQLVKGLLLG